MTNAKRPSGDELQHAILEVRTVMKLNKDLRLHERYQAILIWLQGMTYLAICELTWRTKTTICKYVRNYYSGGLGNLKLRHSPVRPCRLTATQEQAVYQVIVDKTPVDVAFRQR